MSFLWKTNGKTITFVENISKIRFSLTFADILWAISQINRELAIQGYCSLYDFLTYLEVKDELNSAFYQQLGWSLGTGSDEYGYFYIDVSFQAVIKEDQVYVIIDYIFPPHDDYLD